MVVHALLTPCGLIMLDYRAFLCPYVSFWSL
nr:MAG TPA: Prp18 domain [Caudoviricetes sp.]